MARNSVVKGETVEAREGRSKLSRHAVLERAAAVAEGEGLEALTLRRLAQELDVTPTALYWHFADKEALLNGLGDRIWDDVAAALDQELGNGLELGGTQADDPWADCRAIVEALVGALRRHPALAGLAPVRALACESGLRVTERTLACLEALGCEPQRATELAWFTLVTALMLVISQPGGGLTGTQDVQALMRAKRAALLTLDPERFPHVVASADWLIDCHDPDDYFGHGVDLIVGALRSVTAPA